MTHSPLEEARSDRALFPRSALAVAALLVVTGSLAFAESHALGEVERPVELAAATFAGSDSVEAHVHVVAPERVAARDALLDAGVALRERGTRIVYSVHRDRSPVGLLHVRNELGAWGVFELAWSIDLDLTLRDVRLLSCREPAARRAEIERARDSLRGANLDDVLALLRAQGAPAPGEESGRELTRTLLRSAAKALAVTAAGWDHELAILRLRLATTARFPEASSVGMLGATLLADDEEALALRGARTLAPEERSGLLVSRAFDAFGGTLGTVVHARVRHRDELIPVLFVVRDAEITSCQLFVPAPGLRTRAGWLVGRGAENLGRLEDPLVRAAAIALLLAGEERER